METTQKKGAKTLPNQIAALVKEVGKEGENRAKILINSEDPRVISLAFKMLPKGVRKHELGKLEQKTYEQLVASAGQDAADKWKKDRLAEKVK